MKQLLISFWVLSVLFSCKNKKTIKPREFNTVEIEMLLEDSLLSIRAIDILKDKSLAFASNTGVFGLYNPVTQKWRTSIQKHDSLNVNFRAVGHTSTDFFMLSIANPALLYKTGDDGKMSLVYTEKGDNVFYDSMDFWNDQEGIAIGDSTEGIYSIDFYDELNGFAIGGDYRKPDNNSANKIKTNDGGKTWRLVAKNKTPGYRSCVQYFPNKQAKELIAIGFNGIDFSNDAGETWKRLSDEGFYTLRFLNDSIAYAAGAGRISKLTFRE